VGERWKYIYIVWVSKYSRFTLHLCRALPLWKKRREKTWEIIRYLEMQRMTCNATRQRDKFTRRGIQRGITSFIHQWSQQGIVMAYAYKQICRHLIPPPNTLSMDDFYLGISLINFKFHIRIIHLWFSHYCPCSLNFGSIGFVPLTKHMHPQIAARSIAVSRRNPMLCPKYLATGHSCEWNSIVVSFWGIWSDLFFRLISFTMC